MGVRSATVWMSILGIVIDRFNGAGELEYEAELEEDEEKAERRPRM